MHNSYSRDLNYSFYSQYLPHSYNPRVLRAVDEEWRKEKLIMPDIPVISGDLPHEEGDHTANKEEENAWNDLSINEMIGAAHLAVQDRETADQNDMNIYGLNLDSRFFTQNPSLI